MRLDNLAFNWFDLILVIMLMVGISRGRKRGMSEELLSVLTWLAIALGCAFVYQPAGDLLADTNVFSRLASYVIVYVVVGGLIAGGFLLLKRSLGGKLVGSDVFGKSEFYLGMLAGMVRFACILVAGLALLNARFYSDAEIKADRKYQNDVYGSNFFPSLYEVQAHVFQDSLSGPWIKNQLDFLLIKPTAPEGGTFKQKEYAIP